MRLLKTAILLLGVVSASPAYALDADDKGSYFLNSCSGWLSKTGNTLLEFYDQGTCYGSMRMLNYFGKTVGICYPQGVTMGQMARVVVKYINEHPERQHEYYISLSVDALKQAWPCSDK